MMYECYDKNGNYIGFTHSETSAKQKILDANMQLLLKEGYNPLEVFELHKQLEEKMQQEHYEKREEQKTILLVVAAVAAFLFIACLFTN